MLFALFPTELHIYMYIYPPPATVLHLHAGVCKQWCVLNQGSCTRVHWYSYHIHVNYCIHGLKKNKKASFTYNETVK